MGPRQRILQIGYYEPLLKTRAALLKNAGYQVASVLGNEQGKSAANAFLPEVDAVLVGFSGRYEERAAMLCWLKQWQPGLPVVMLQAGTSERFDQADKAVVGEDPELWLAALAACLDGRGT